MTETRSRHMQHPRHGRAMLGTALLAGLAILDVAACDPKAPPPPPPPDVTVAEAIGKPVTDYNEYSGRFTAVDAAEVRPRVSGYVTKVAFPEGRFVHKGELLFKIDARPYQQDLDRAEAALTQARTRASLAESEAQRAKRLVEAQAISREEFDSRTSSLADNQAAVKAAESAVESARLNLDWTDVRAPISGRVSRAEVTLGNLVQSGPQSSTLLTTVVSQDPIYVYFDGDEQTYLEYAHRPAARRTGTAADDQNIVWVGLVNETGFPHRGRLDFVDNHVDPVTGTIKARAVFSNADGTFTPGLFARVKVPGGPKVNATLIRDAAVGTDQDKKYVLVLKPDNTVDYRPIQLGPLTDGLRVIKSGLKPGERIVVNGLQRVRPGMKVTVHEAPMIPDTTSSTSETRAASR
jgi:RND family efflux transporter MFP subunit